MMNPSLSSLRKIMHHHARSSFHRIDVDRSKNEAVVATPRVKYE